MIDTIDKKYGRVIIYEVEDIEGKGLYSSMEMEEGLLWKYEMECLESGNTASIVGFRNAKERYIRLLKNRYGPLEDYETEQFVLNYSLKKDPPDDPINSRFQILDFGD